MHQQSGLAKAGRILLLVGAILAVVGGAALVVLGAVFLVLGDLEGDAGAFVPGRLIGAVYFVLGILQGVGAIFGFLAHGRARRGDWHGAWVFGLVAALVPPLQVVPLLGAIFCLVSPEGDATKSANGTSQPL